MVGDTKKTVNFNLIFCVCIIISFTCVILCCSFEKKVIHLKQAGSRSMGFNIRGGMHKLTANSVF